MNNSCKLPQSIHIAPSFSFYRSTRVYGNPPYLTIHFSSVQLKILLHCFFYWLGAVHVVQVSPIGIVNVNDQRHSRTCTLRCVLYTVQHRPLLLMLLSLVFSVLAFKRLQRPLSDQSVPNCCKRLDFIFFFFSSCLFVYLSNLHTHINRIMHRLLCSIRYGSLGWYVRCSRCSHIHRTEREEGNAGVYNELVHINKCPACIALTLIVFNLKQVKSAKPINYADANCFFFLQFVNVCEHDALHVTVFSLELLVKC